MLFTKGNAADDGAPFGSWFIGDLEGWSKRNEAVNHPRDLALRQSSRVEVKWGTHRAGEGRADWASCSDKTTMSLLVRGKFLLRFRAPDHREQVIEQRLEHEGDYAVWGTSAEHTWFVEEDAVIFTVRWKENSLDPA